MVYGDKKKDDQIAGGSGQNRSASGQSQSVHLFFQILSSRFYTTSAICNIGFASVSQNRLSRYNPDAQRLFRFTKSFRPKESTALLHTLLRRKTAPKKRVFESLLNGIFDLAEGIGLPDEHPQAAIDATGFAYGVPKGGKPSYQSILCPQKRLQTLPALSLAPNNRCLRHQNSPVCRLYCHTRP